MDLDYTAMGDLGDLGDLGTGDDDMDLINFGDDDDTPLDS